MKKRLLCLVYEELKKESFMFGRRRKKSVQDSYFHKTESCVAVSSHASVVSAGQCNFIKKTSLPQIPLDNSAEFLISQDGVVHCSLEPCASRITGTMQFHQKTSLPQIPLDKQFIPILPSSLNERF
jgi:hypothetical protein